MGALNFAAVLLFQDAATMTNDVHYIMICEVILTAIVVLLLLGIAIAGLVIYSKITKLVKQVDAKSQPLIAQATPLVAKGKEIAGHVSEIVADLKPKIAAVSADLQPKIAAVTADLQPKIASVTSDVQHISSVVRSKIDEAGQTFSRVNETVQGYNETAQEVNTKAKGQVERVNGIVSEALTSTQHVSKQIQHGIKVPVEKIAAWVTAAKIGIEHLSERLPFLHQNPQRNTAPRSSTAYSRSTPGPVPVPPAGVRVVHSPEDEAKLDTLPERPTPNSSF